MLFAELESKFLCRVSFENYDPLSRLLSKVDIYEKERLLFLLSWCENLRRLLGS
jgi:hypothetical protein